MTLLGYICCTHLPPLYCQHTQNKWCWKDKECYHSNANEKEWEEAGSSARLSPIVQKDLHMKMGNGPVMCHMMYVLMH